MLNEDRYPWLTKAKHFLDNQKGTIERLKTENKIDLLEIGLMLAIQKADPEKIQNGVIKYLADELGMSLFECDKILQVFLYALGFRDELFKQSSQKILSAASVKTRYFFPEPVDILAEQQKLQEQERRKEQLACGNFDLE